MVCGKEENDHMDSTNDATDANNHPTLNDEQVVDMDGNGGALPSTSHPQLVILDAGAQYGKLIDRRVRELCVHSEILPLDTPAAEIQLTGAK
jgi:hypothetical protein